MNAPIASFDRTPDERGWIREDVWSNDVASSGQYGDYAVGTGYEARYTRRLHDGTYAVVTLGYYVEDLNLLRNKEEGDEDWEEFPWSIREQAEFMHCTDPDDPGGTEITSDYQYEDIYDRVGSDPSLERYENECRALALQDARRGLYFMEDQAVSVTTDKEN